MPTGPGRDADTHEHGCATVGVPITERGGAHTIAIRDHFKRLTTFRFHFAQCTDTRYGRGTNIGIGIDTLGEYAGVKAERERCGCFALRVYSR